ncbi:hypothetical protein Bca4012_060394 [Brassica carinata]
MVRSSAGFLRDSRKSKVEHTVKIVAKSLSQGADIFKYFKLYRDYSVTNDREIPEFEFDVFFAEFLRLQSNDLGFQLMFLKLCKLQDWIGYLLVFFG